MDKLKYNVRVNDDCISIIAGICATRIDGVVNLSGGMTSNVLPFMATNNLKKGVEIIKENDGLTIKVSVSVREGYSVDKVCSKVQEKIKDTIESMLDMNVKTVMVRVAGIEEDN